MTRMFYITLLGLLAMCLAASADSVTLTLAPSDGSVSGLPGDSVGWGYTLVNGSSDYLLVANSYFCESGQDPLFTTCSPSLGASTYQDFIANDFTLIAPGGSADATFDAVTNSGVGEYNIDPLVTSGSDSGSLTIVYDLYDADPTMGAANQICPNDSVCDWEVSASAQVLVAGTSTVPEPRLPIFLAFGFLALIAYRSAAKLRPE
jgi:hypothetical protein